LCQHNDPNDLSINQLYAKKLVVVKE
jgi:hypothetical protein